jgi:FAD/FMN-containing dehydrogenase
VLDAPEELSVDRWGPLDPGVLALMGRLRERFDPDGICNPGLMP